MNIKSTLSVAALILLAASACKKESGSKSPIDGNWNFTSTSASTSSTVSANNGGDYEKIITTSNYTSTNNAGTISIGGGVMTAKGLSYSVSATAHYVDSLDGYLNDEGDQDISFTLPATNSTSNFKVVGADSIYFPSGGFSSYAGGSVSGPAGGKFSLSGNTLTITMKLDTTFTDNSLGFPALKHDVATQSTILARQ